MTLVEQYDAANHFGRTLGMEYKIIEPGHIHYKLTVKPEHLATPMAAHGGVISALMDGLLGVAALSSVYEEKKVVSTIEFKINFMAPALLDDELLGIAKVEQKGNRLIIVSGEITCPKRDNVIIAKALGTFNAYPAEKAGFII